MTVSADGDRLVTLNVENENMLRTWDNTGEQLEALSLNQSRELVYRSTDGLNDLNDIKLQ